ncbi:hypothetical protein RJT34_02343 [Clitoria ternatea]|uniref:Uncharacterized protein n=1 Tax=Clitoria ternatea TaxID=43366 RepID=A0AAN9KH38_CLITE
MEEELLMSDSEIKASRTIRLVLLSFGFPIDLTSFVRQHSVWVAATSDLMLAYLDFFLGGDEKRSDLPPHLHQRFPMCIIFGGDGSYMSPFSLHSDNILTSIMS